MPFRKITFVVARCNGCGAGWWPATAETEPVFDSEKAARRQLEDDYGWLFDRDLATGQRLMLCSSCRTRSVCSLRGCERGEPLLPDGRLPVCTRCYKVVRIDQPGHGHEQVPDTGLPEVLAELERVLAKTGDNYGR